MKCGTLVKVEERRRKGSGKLYEKVTRWYYRGYPEDAIPEPRSELRVCTGNIIATIAAENEPDWGCTYAALSITYKCDKCENTAYPFLPHNAQSLSKFVTDTIAGDFTKDALGKDVPMWFGNPW